MRISCECGETESVKHYFLDFAFNDESTSTGKKKSFFSFGITYLNLDLLLDYSENNVFGLKESIYACYLDSPQALVTFLTNCFE